MTDAINPSHYKHLPVEAIDIIDAAIEGAPSPQAAAAQSHLLGYALRANQKGQLATDAGKTEWYAARWLKAIREAEAKASGSNEPILQGESEEPEPSRTQPPSGYRMLGDAKDEPRIEGDRYWSSIRGWTVLTSHKVEYANQENWAACRKIEKPKRYREPTQADLANGPIECEVRQGNLDAWDKRTLIYVFSEYGFPFVCVWASQGSISRWNQCRIEVQE